MMAKTPADWNSSVGEPRRDSGWFQREAWLLGSLPHSGDKYVLTDTDPSTTCLYPSIPSLICSVLQFCLLSQHILLSYLYPSFWSENLHIPSQDVYINSWVPPFPFSRIFCLVCVPECACSSWRLHSSSSCFSVPNTWLIQAWSSKSVFYPVTSPPALAPVSWLPYSDGVS